MVATYNIGVKDCCLAQYLNVDRYDEQLGAVLPDIVCLQECSWSSRIHRVKMMLDKGYYLLGQTRGGKRDASIICEFCNTKSTTGDADYVCLETYVRLSSVKSQKIVLESENFRTSNCSHEVLYNLSAIGDDWQSKRRQHILACKVQFSGKKLWVLNIHLPAGAPYYQSSENVWKWIMPVVDEFYSEDMLVVAGDWNFDAPAAFAADSRNVVGRGTPFEPPCDVPAAARKLVFHTSDDPTYRLYKKKSAGDVVEDVNVRIDAVAASEGHFLMEDYSVIWPDELEKGEHSPLQCVIKSAKNSGNYPS